MKINKFISILKSKGFVEGRDLERGGYTRYSLITLYRNKFKVEIKVF